MTTNHHTPLEENVPVPADLEVINVPLEELDAAITEIDSEVINARGVYNDLEVRLNSIALAGGNISTLADGVTPEGYTSLKVLDASTGFIIGARVAYATENGLEYNQITDIPDGTHLVVSAVGGDIADQSLVTMISQSEYEAALAPNHGAAIYPTLAKAMSWAARGAYNVNAYGAQGGSTNDTAAIQAAIDAAMAAGGGLVIFPDNVYTFAEPLVVDESDDIRLEGNGYTKLIYTGTNGVALTFSAASGQNRWRCGTLGLKLYADLLDGDPTYWLPITALRLQNCYGFDAQGLSIEGFEYAIHVHGEAKGCVYNRFHIDEIYNNKKSFYVTCANSGWAADNNFYGGRAQIYLLEEVGTKGLWLPDIGSGLQISQIRFYGTCIEGNFETPVQIDTEDPFDIAFFGTHIEDHWVGCDTLVDSMGTRVSFYSTHFSRSGVDVVVREGAGPHYFYGSPANIVDENIPGVVRGISDMSTGLGDETAISLPTWGGNLVPNGRFKYWWGSDANFNDHPRGWALTYTSLGGGGVCSKDTAEAQVGTYAFKFINTSVVKLHPYIIISLIPGQQYTIRLRSRCTAMTGSDKAVLKISSSVTDSPTDGLYLNSNLVCDNTWHEVTYQFTPLVDAVYVYVLYYTSAAFTAYLDDMVIVAGTGTHAVHSAKPITEEGGEFYDAPRLLNCTVALLPTGSSGKLVYASDGRKAGEGAGVGTGVLVFCDGASHWIAVDTGLTVAA